MMAGQPRCLSCLGLRARWNAYANGLPIAVLVGYLLIAWTESFPTTAYSSLMQDELGMSLPSIYTFYAVTFLPFLGKPLYGWVSDNFPVAGYYRTPYICVAAMGSAVCHLVTALLVRSVRGFFVATFCRAVCNAFMQLMVGTFLVDVARRDVKNSAALQGLANAAGWLGTAAAKVLALAIYAHGERGRLHHPIGNARLAIGLTAVAPAVLAGMALTLPEERGLRVASPTTRNSEQGALAAGLAIVQANLLLVGCRTLMDGGLWQRLLAFSVAVSTCLIAFLLFSVHRRAQAAAGLRGREDTLPSNQLCHWLRLCTFCFLCNALPNSSIAVDQLQFRFFTPSSYQALGLISSVASLLASLVFGARLNRWSTRRMFAASTVLAAFLGLAPWPFASLALGANKGGHELVSEAGGLAIASAIGLAAQLFSTIAVDTLITSESGSVAGHSSTAYAFLLSVFGLGGTVGGLVSAPILQSMSPDGQNWRSVPDWVLITAAIRLLLLALLPLIPDPCHRGDSSLLMRSSSLQDPASAVDPLSSH
mmetsp:Transcript_91/g.323  ORF Transcript_91/g.323 Transcript_91/m.323 type:complete len:536 (+) Transcript_91:86-1693(+)